jgi:hypothetical protein
MPEPRPKLIDWGMKLPRIDVSVPLLPSTFEHALRHLVEHELVLRILKERCRNDAAGGSAYARSVMFKVILYAYSQRIIWREVLFASLMACEFKQ